MSDSGETFFTSIGCMDGRVQAVVSLYGQNMFDAKYPDTITEAGLVGLLANNPSSELLESLKKKILISAQLHHSKGIVVHGHQDCAGNPVEDERHKQDVVKASAVIRQLSPDLIIKPVFVARFGSGWKVIEL